MPVAGIVTLIGVALVVAALAIYLIWVAALLQRVSSMLTSIIDRLWGIAGSAEPLGGAVTEINRDLDAANRTLHQVLQKKAQARQPGSGAAGRDGGSGAGNQGSSPGARKATGRKSTGRKPSGQKTVSG